jgi:chemotaxis protein MotB
MVLAGSMTLLTVGCGGPSRAERAQAEKDAQIRSLREDQAAAAAREKALLEQQQLALAQNQKQAMTLQEMATRGSQAQMASNQKMDALQMQLAEMEKRLGARPGGEVELVRGDKINSITIRVFNSTLFDVGKADLKDSSHAKLQEIAKLLKTEFKDNFVRVEGHTDSTPIVRNKEKFADNMELSQARSKAVFDYLIKSCSMPANRMYTAGYAYSQPVVWPEKTTADRAKNRRVDIVILPNIKVEKQSVAASK